MTSPSPSAKTLKVETEKRSKSLNKETRTIDMEMFLDLTPSTSARGHRGRRREMPSLHSRFNGCLASKSKMDREVTASLDDLSKIKQRMLKNASSDGESPMFGPHSSSRSQSASSSTRSKFASRFATCYGPGDGIRVVGSTDPDTDPDPNAGADADADTDTDYDNEPKFEIPIGTMRTNSLWDFCQVDNCKVRLSNVSLMLNNQQKLLLTELISTLVGSRCDLITPLPRSESAEDITKYETEFKVHEKMDKTLGSMVQEIVPLASFYMGIQKLVALTEDQSQVNNALNSALVDLTSDYYLLLGEAEVEHLEKRLTLQKMLYYMQPTIWVMKNIWITLSKILLNDLKGAAVLTNFCDSIKQLEGDTSSQTSLMDLTGKAAQPYMNMIQLWIEKGIIMDTYDEFMIVDNESNHMRQLRDHYSDIYWQKRYTIREECIPSFLDKYANMILRTGKYLNVVRQCGMQQIPSQNMELSYDPKEEHKHIQVINDAYTFSARMLLDVLLNENDMMGHLQSVNRYLLLNQGDFILEFMDACENELAKNVDHVLPIALENLLGLTLRLTCARNDRYKDNVHCQLLTYDLVTQMSKIIKPTDLFWDNTDRLDLSGLECFAFTYVAKWPVSLVLNHTSVSKYQMLFRQLFFCKHVERQLCRIWKENSVAKKFTSNTAELYRSAFTLRQRMMNAIQNLEYYMMIETIEPNWHIFIEKMKLVENIDTVFNLHQDFLDVCLKNCMLTEPPDLNRAIFQLCKICLKFCDFIQQSQRFFLDAELKSMVRDSSDENTDHSDSELLSGLDREKVESSMNHSDTFAERVKSFDSEFTGMLISFLRNVLELVHTNASFINLVHRINFNGYYTRQLEQLRIK